MKSQQQRYPIANTASHHAICIESDHSDLDDGPPGLEDIEESTPAIVNRGGINVKQIEETLRGTSGSQSSNASSSSSASPQVAPRLRALLDVPVSELLSENSPRKKTASKFSMERSRITAKEKQEKSVESVLQTLTRSFNWSPRSPDDTKRKKLQAAEPAQNELQLIFTTTEQQQEKRQKKQKRQLRNEESETQQETNRQADARRSARRLEKKQKSHPMNRQEIVEYIERVNESIRVANEKTESLPRLQKSARRLVQQISEAEEADDLQKAWSTKDMVASKRECLNYLRENEALIEELNKQSKICSKMGKTLVDFHEIITVQLQSLRERCLQENSLAENYKSETKPITNTEYNSIRTELDRTVAVEEDKQAQEKARSAQLLIAELTVTISSLKEELIGEKALRLTAEKLQSIKATEYEQLYEDALEAREVIHDEMRNIQAQKEELQQRLEAIAEKENSIRLTKQQQPQQQQQQQQFHQRPSLLEHYGDVKDIKRQVPPYRQFLQTLDTSDSRDYEEQSAYLRSAAQKQNPVGKPISSVDSALTIFNDYLKYQTDKPAFTASTPTTNQNFQNNFSPPSKVFIDDYSNRDRYPTSEQLTGVQFGGGSLQKTQAQQPSRFRAGTFGVVESTTPDTKRSSNIAYSFVANKGDQITLQTNHVLKTLQKITPEDRRRVDF